MKITKTMQVIGVKFLLDMSEDKTHDWATECFNNLESVVDWGYADVEYAYAYPSDYREGQFLDKPTDNEWGLDPKFPNLEPWEASRTTVRDVLREIVPVVKKHGNRHFYGFEFIEDGILLSARYFKSPVTRDEYWSDIMEDVDSVFDAMIAGEDD